MPVSRALIEIGAQRAHSFVLRKGDVLRIVDRCGKQVADITMFGLRNGADGFSPGRTIDYNQSIRLAVGDVLYSNASAEMARVVEDTVGTHDMLLAPCSKKMFARRNEFDHPSCHANLVSALSSFGIGDDLLRATLNVFMDVRIDERGAIRIQEPASQPGGTFAIEALQDLAVGIAACSSELTNGGLCKPIYYEREFADRRNNARPSQVAASRP